MNRYLMALDLEMNQPSNSIVQIGIAVGDLETKQVVYSESINVYQPEQVTEYITKLTGITQADVDAGAPLLDAYAKVFVIHKQYNCLMNPVTWGGGDSELLRKQLGFTDTSWIFGRRWIDVKTLFVSRCIARGEKIQSGLAKSLTRVGLQFVGSKHNAGDDAVNTMRMYFKMLEEFRNASRILDLR